MRLNGEASCTTAGGLLIHHREQFYSAIIYHSDTHAAFPGRTAPAELVPPPADINLSLVFLRSARDNQCLVDAAPVENSHLQPAGTLTLPDLNVRTRRPRGRRGGVLISCLLQAFDHWPRILIEDRGRGRLGAMAGGRRPRNVSELFASGRRIRPSLLRVHICYDKEEADRMTLAARTYVFLDHGDAGSDKQ